MIRSLAALALGVSLAMAAPAWAQRSGDGFLFRAPSATITLRGGYERASAGSDLFSFVTDTLTLGRSDFSGPTIGGDLGVRLTERLELVLGASYSGVTAGSEFRNWVDADDLPIEQTTTFQRVPVTLSARAYLTPRGRSIGRFAWLPARYAVYVGGGGGGMWYRFSQEGDFVDFQTLDVFYDKLESQGWTATGQAFAGADLRLTSRLWANLEARHTWAKDELSESFEGFDPIDLAGSSVNLGIKLSF